MGSKKILVVSRSFYPENSPRAFRTTELVKEFARQGHKVTLYTLKDENHHPGFEKKYGVRIKNLGQPLFRTISTAGGQVKNFSARALNRGLNLFLEYPNIELLWRIRNALKDENGYDLLISVAVPHPVHWGVAAVRTDRHRIADVWVADCGDPYMGQETDSFSKLFYFKYIEKWFCRKADYLTVPIEDAKNAYYSEFRDKIKVIPQGFNFEESEPDKTNTVHNTVPTFAYAGGLMPGSRDPSRFLDYLVSKNWDFHFILFTRSRHMVEPWLKKATGRIELRDYKPRKELLQELAGMDFLVNFENNTTVQLPSKLIDYHIAGRPVLSVGSDRIDRKKVDQFLAGDYSAQLRLNDMDQYRIENVCDQFLNLCKL